MLLALSATDANRKRVRARGRVTGREEGMNIHVSLFALSNTRHSRSD